MAGEGAPSHLLGKREGFSKLLELRLYGLYLCSLGPALGWESGDGAGRGCLRLQFGVGSEGWMLRRSAVLGVRGGRWSRRRALAGESPGPGLGLPGTLGWRAHLSAAGRRPGPAAAPECPLSVCPPWTLLSLLPHSLLGGPSSKQAACND